MSSFISTTWFSFSSSSTVNWMLSAVTNPSAGFVSVRVYFSPSTIPAIGTALLGMLTGRFVKLDDNLFSRRKKALYIALAGVAFALIGWGWNFFYPINKALWSSSFVCAVAGYSLLMFALFYYIIDVLNWRHWDFFFVVIGMNSITIYLARRFAFFNGVQHALFDGLVNQFPEMYQPIVAECSFIAVQWIFLYFLYKHKVFLKV